MLSSTPSRLNLGSRKDRFSTRAACRLAQVLALASLVLPAPGSEPPVPFEVSFKSTPGDDKEKSFQLRQASDAKDIFDIIPVVGDEWKTWPYFLHVKQEGRSENDFLTFEVWRGNRTLNRAVKHDVRHVDQSRAGRELDVTLEFFNAFVPISVRKIRQTLLFDITNESPWPLSLPVRRGIGDRVNRSTLEVIVRLSRTSEERVQIQDNFPMGVIPPGKHFQVQVPTWSPVLVSHVGTTSNTSRRCPVVCPLEINSQPSNGGRLKGSSRIQKKRNTFDSCISYNI
jgi:hypothetical protein